VQVKRTPPAIEAAAVMAMPLSLDWVMMLPATENDMN
jgi:hypothetical protein